ncbi:MAG: insulinase family protein [Lewinellaceae bacterium]|nr:insulinase family protein [Lewinellaceae bacterium]
MGTTLCRTTMPRSTGPTCSGFTIPGSRPQLPAVRQQQHRSAGFTIAQPTFRAVEKNCRKLLNESRLCRLLIPAGVPENQTRRLLQTAIKIGRRAFNRRHPDFNGLYVLNAILGGYFGSRLMTNIREKGFTYNIYSTLDAYLHDGCLHRYGSRPRLGNRDAQEIFAEMQKLREEPVSEKNWACCATTCSGCCSTASTAP